MRDRCGAGQHSCRPAVTTTSPGTGGGHALTATVTPLDPARIMASLRIAAAAVKAAKTRADRARELRRCDILLDRLNTARRRGR